MAIKQIQIRNFRSILMDEFDPTDLNLIVGPNDAGKSNYLRALNLFFNNTTEPNTPLNWKVDYSYLAQKRNKKAEEIVIALTFEPPHSFSSREPIIWTKTWRAESITPYRNEKLTEAKKQLSGRQKLDAWLERIKFKYVPAIKGPEYFRALLRDLHDTLAITIDQELRGASTDFLDSLRNATSGLSGELQEALGLESRLQLPGNLGSFFEVLDFETSSAAGRSLSLQQRGDGIKVRHIPAILKFLADQEVMLAAKGRPRVTTVWGYEEPENNLELMASFEAARHFKSYSSEIQTFVTTHSPAFYSLATDGVGGTKAWYVTKGNIGTKLSMQAAGDIEKIDHALGLMQLITPYVASAEQDARLLKERLANVVAGQKPLVFVGGPTDKVYLQKSLAILTDGSLQKRFDIEFIGTSRPQGDEFSGDSSLKQTFAFLRNNPTYASRPTLLLFDCDARQPSSIEGLVSTFGIPANPRNTKMKVGIENLLDESCFTESDYSTKETVGSYGERKSNQVFNKVACAERISNLGNSDPEAQKAFSGFQVVLTHIQAWLDGLPPTSP